MENQNPLHQTDLNRRQLFGRFVITGTILFLWYFGHCALDEFGNTHSKGASAIVGIVIAILLKPFFYAGLLSMLYAVLRSKNFSAVSFCTDGAQLYLPFFLVNMACVIVFGLARWGSKSCLDRFGIQSMDTMMSCLLSGIFFFGLMIIYCSLMVERGRIGKAISNGMTHMTKDPSVLVAGLTASVLVALDTHLHDLFPAVPKGVHFGWIAIRSLIMTFGVMASFVTTIKAYCRKCVSVEEYERAFPESGVVPDDQTAEQSASPIILAFLSFVPVLCIFSLVSGVKGVQATKGRSISSIMVLMTGFFFTTVYILVLVGALIPKSSLDPAAGITSAEIIEAAPEMEKYARMLDTAEFNPVIEALTDRAADTLQPRWAVLLVRGLAKNNLLDTNGAVADYESALQLNSTSSLIHYAYGHLLLNQHAYTSASNHFKRAAEMDPQNEKVRGCLALTQSTYAPSRAVSIVWSILILLILFTVHEYAHAWCAHRLGDDTAYHLGRVTLNPLAHLDLIGSILLPGLMLLRSSDLLFGWAKPVPVDTKNLKDPAKDHMMIAFAGPAANLIAALAAVLFLMALAIIVRIAWPHTHALNLAEPYGAIIIAGIPSWLAPVFAFVKQILYTSLILACFNLLPIPPLDGGWILEAKLSERAKATFASMKPALTVGFFLLIFTPVFDYILSIPVIAAWAILHMGLLAIGLA